MKRLVGTLCGALALFSFAGPARAEENSVTSSNPAEGEAVDVAPTQIQMLFQNPIGGPEALAQVKIALTCNQRLVGLGQLQLGADGKTVSVPLIQLPDAGTCVVSWSIGTESSGTFSFVNNAAIPTTTADPTQPTTTVDPTATTVPGEENPDDTVASAAPRLGGPVGLARTASFLFISAIVGGLGMIALVWPEGAEYTLTERYLRLMSVLAIASTYLLVSLVTAQRTGTSVGTAFTPTEWFELLSNPTGRGVFLRFVLLCAMVYFAWIPERILDPATRPPAMVVLVLLVATYGFDRTGGSAAAFGALLNSVHMALVFLWVGGALMLMRVVLAGPGEEDLLQALRGWCRLATPLIIALAVTGLLMVWRLDGSNILNSGHGRLVAFKSVLSVGLLVIEGAMRQYVLGRLNRDRVLTARAVFTLRKSATLQMSLSLVLLATSSWLMSMRPPNLLPEQTGPKITYAVRQEMKGDDGFHVAVSLKPGTVGVNELLIELYEPERVQRFVVKLTPVNPAYSGYEIAVPIERRGAAQVTLESGLQLKAVGEWKIEVTGATTTGDLEPLTSTFTLVDPAAVTTTIPGSTATTTTTTTIPSG